MNAFLLSVVLAQATAAPVLTLDDALRAAAEQNLDLVAARARLEKAQSASRRAWAGYLPTLTAGASYTRNSTGAEITLPVSYHIRDVGSPVGPGPGDPTQEPTPEKPPGGPTPYILFPAELASVTVQEQNQFGGQVELRQAILAPALWAAISNATTSEELAAMQYDAIRRELLFSVARAWFGAVGLREAVQVQERLLQIQEKHQEQARIRYEAGAVPKIDLLRAQIDHTRAEQDLVRTRNALLAAKSTLATLLAREPDFELPSRDALPAQISEASPDAVLNQALEQRPEIRAAALGQKLAAGTRRMAWLGYLPTVGLNAQYRISNVAGFAGELDTWAVTVGVQWTIWDGGLREIQLREAAADQREADANARATDLRIRDEVRRALLEVESARANRVKAAQTLQLANETLQLVQTAYQAGGATSLDVSNATAGVLSAELTQLNESVSAHLAALGVLKAAGAFDVKTESTP